MLLVWARLQALFAAEAPVQSDQLSLVCAVEINRAAQDSHGTSTLTNQRILSSAPRRWLCTPLHHLHKGWL